MPKGDGTGPPTGRGQERGQDERQPTRGWPRW